MSPKPETSPPDPRAVLDAMAAGVFTVNADLVVTAMNAEAERILGVSRPKAVGARCAALFRAGFSDAEAALRRAMEEGRDLRGLRLALSDESGRAGSVDIAAGPLRDAGGKIAGGVLTLMRTSERTCPENETGSERGLGDCVSNDARMRKIFEMLRMAAPSDASLLILGETGTGKDLLARSAHALSGRKDGPFIKINCAALPEPLLESELFGYKKGAFTDAKKDKPGMFRLAHGGTLFLDEAGELPLNIQAKLLQAIEDKRYYPLGASSPQEADARILAATNRDLAAAVASGDFRADLYYRLRVLEIRIPPLRERRGDIALLADHFLARLAARHGKDIRGISPEAARLLFSHDYPGNVRELMHILEHAVILCPAGEIQLEHLPESLLAPAQKALDETSPPLEKHERDSLLETLEAHGWNVGKAAEAMGVNRTTVWRRMKKHGL